MAINETALRRNINIRESLKMLSRKCSKYSDMCRAYARTKFADGKWDWTFPKLHDDFEREMMPLLEQICGDRLGENPNDPSHPLYRWKA